MNRIQLLAADVDDDVLEHSQLEQPVADYKAPEHDPLQFTPARREGTPQHSLFVPLHYEANYAYPLLVWLHGPAGHARELQRVMPLISMRNYVAVAPQGRLAMDSGFDWGTSAESLEAARRSVMDCVQIAKDRFNIAPHRVFLGGFATGGTLAIRLGLQQPEAFAGALSAGGHFPVGGRPLVHLDEARNLPILIAHGRDAEKYPIEKVCDELRLFHAAGLQVTLRQYPCGDDLTTQMLHDIDVWMMEQVTGTPCDSSSMASSLDQLN